MYLRGVSVETILRAATKTERERDRDRDRDRERRERDKFQTKLAISLIQSMVTPGQPVLVLTL